MSDAEGDTFCKKMRKATREIHAVSDALVNAKLAFGFNDEKVWADGLLVFFEIFRYLEGAIERLKSTKIGLLNLRGLKRTEAFEQDLEHYLGRDWKKNYMPRESVTKYLMRLREVEDTDPSLLMAYAYHLYMGLLSGGTILRKKRALMQKITPFREASRNGTGKARANTGGGDRVTDFGDRSIHELKCELRDTMNEIAESLDEDTRNKLIEESKIVYSLNNELIRSIRGVGIVIIKKIVYLVLLIALLLYVVLVIFKK